MGAKREDDEELRLLHQIMFNTSPINLAYSSAPTVHEMVDLVGRRETKLSLLRFIAQNTAKASSGT